MSLSYNKDTAVERDYKTQNQSDSTFLSDTNIQQESQNERVSYERVTNGTETVTDDFIATQCVISAQCGDNASSGSADIEVLISGVSIAKISLYSNAGSEQTQSLAIPLPNWIIRKGEVITYTITLNDATAYGCVIGYKI